MKPMWVFRYLVSAAWVLVLLFWIGGKWQETSLPATYAASDSTQAQAVACWDCVKVLDPVVIQDGGIFKMWYTGVGLDGEARIGYAASSDGVTWTKHADNPVLDIGPSGSWDQSWVRVGAVIKQGGTYHMWYTSNATGAVGYATSSDGITWGKYSGNPVFTKGSDNSWDGRFIVLIGVLL
ncbi:MAG: hypothetical protein RMK79_04365, partial [Anaerolineae bacterium]|nr:hypothetical protein [Anaerolineae bacterium]